MTQQERASFGSKLGVILATAGSAVGLGNVWRFPYMAGEYGGAAFIIIYVGCVLLFGIPCMVSEFIIGRHAASNTARAYHSLSGGTPWAVIGYFGVFTGLLITSYYAVVAGWCLQYILASMSGQLHGSPEFFADYFAAFEKDPFKPVLWTVAIILLTHYVIAHGVRGGIEKASKLMMPALFVLLIIVVVSACLLPGAAGGVAFLFKPDFSTVGGDVFLGALGQSFYSAGISPDSGPSLVFITLPNVFQQAFAGVPVVGNIVAVAFYALLTLAALTSLISLHEVSTAFVHEEMHTTRRRAAWVVTAVCSVVGAICSLSLGKWDFLKIGDRSLFDFFDFATGQIMLPLGGFLTCLFVGWYLPHKMVRDEFTNWGTLRGKLFHVYLFCIKFVCPVCILLIFLHQFGLI